MESLPRAGRGVATQSSEQQQAKPKVGEEQPLEAWSSKRRSRKWERRSSHSKLGAATDEAKSGRRATTQSLEQQQAKLKVDVSLGWEENKKAVGRDVERLACGGTIER